MADEEYTPLIDREREPESRIHQELTPIARERLSVITETIWGTDHLDAKLQKKAMDYLMEKAGRSPVLTHTHSDKDSGGVSIDKAHFRFITRGDSILVLTYIERLFLEYFSSRGGPERTDIIQSTSAQIQSRYGPIEEYLDIFDSIREVLITEGILYEMDWADAGGVIEFTPLESEAMKDIDEKVQALAEKEPWGKALKGYNAAFERYLNGDFDEVIPKKLYNSIEQVLKTICIDETGWTDNDELVHSEYLEILKEKGVYDAHGATAPELGSLLDSLNKMVAKVSDDRKQRHIYHDRAYSTLLIHQVGAYLYFLISRFETFDSADTG